MGEAFAALATSELFTDAQRATLIGALRHLHPVARPAGRATPATRTASGRAPHRTPRSPRGSRSRCCRPSSPTSRSRGCGRCSTPSPRTGWPPRPRPSCASRSCSASATRAPRRWPGSRRCAASPRPSSTRSRTSAPAATRPGTRSATRARSPRRPIARGRWRCIAPSGAEELIEADVCVVGSGAGGGVIAGELAAAGKSVCVLEMGGYHDDRDFDGLELSAYQRMYLNGGPFPTAEGRSRSSPAPGSAAAP